VVKAKTFSGLLALIGVAAVGLYAIDFPLPHTGNGQITGNKSRKVQLVVTFEPHVRNEVIQITHSVNGKGPRYPDVSKLSPWNLHMIAKPGDAIELGAFQKERGLLTCYIFVEKTPMHSQANDRVGGVNCHVVVE
jgi:hypothetical protein